MPLVRGSEQGADGRPGVAWERPGAPGHPQPTGVITAPEDERHGGVQGAQHVAYDRLGARPGLDLPPGASRREVTVVEALRERHEVQATGPAHDEFTVYLGPRPDRAFRQEFAVTTCQ
ncbi:hypothetical protein [Pseudonocardia xinjiangensis]|uniref:Uncharacterized protein n=1 Tax=Pseudonocardia xinjiangensis TaxID=75289 RepID=A0ABX1RJF6_9PSEU|nr:hypothetical protein [Pseudonocardia xinjiangensis]NMH80503.1 hypothetical protein [Pseudonocardia xinjiangensis]